MKERFERTMPYLIFIIVAYYSLPIILVAALRESAAGIYQALPALDICFSMGACFFFGKRHGGDWLMAIESSLVFLPCIYIFFNPTAWIYFPIIALLSLLAVFIGTVFKNRFL